MTCRVHFWFEPAQKLSGTLFLLLAYTGLPYRGGPVYDKSAVKIVPFFKKREILYSIDFQLISPQN